MKKRRNSFLKRCTAAAMAVCIALSISGVGEIIATIIGGLSVTAAADGSILWNEFDADNIKIGDHLIYSEDLDAASTTVLFNHWHLQEQGGKVATVAYPDEFRFYSYTVDNNGTAYDTTDDTVNVYLFAKVTNLYNIKTKAMYEGNDKEDKENEFELVEIFKVTGNDYSKVQFVISPQIPNPIEVSESKGIRPANEKFSNFSISSGHDSATAYLKTDSAFGDYDGEYGVIKESDLKEKYPDKYYNGYPDKYARMVITYHPESVNHIIKGHAFYVSDIVTMVGADFANKQYFTLPTDDEKYNSAPNADNDQVLNPYWVWDEGSTHDKNGTGKIVYTGEIDTYVYDYTSIETDANGDKIDKTVIYYNTSAGLHTNKTASVTAGDESGRLFDVNLETWYAGEDIADVGFVLDASGSMAWTTDILAPMEIDPEKVEALLKKYNLDENTYISTYGSAASPATEFLTADQVNELLNTANTDNTRLSYSEYNYYIYDARSSVAEFVSLGYWGGNITSSPLQKPVDPDEILASAIGHYSFEENLKNEISGNSATLVNKNTFEEVKDKLELPVTTAYSQGGIALKETAENGPILLDVKPNTTSFSVSFQVKVIDNGKNKSEPVGTYYNETPIMYIGNLSQPDKYYRIVRGSKRWRSTTGNAGALAELRVYDSTTTQPYSDDEEKMQDNTAYVIEDKNAFPNVETYYTCTVVFNNNNVSIYTEGNGEQISYSSNINATSLSTDGDGIRIIIGGNNCVGLDTYSEVYVKNVKVYDTVLTSLAATADQEENNLIGSYSLDGTLENAAAENSSATVINQYTGGSFSTSPKEGEIVDVSDAVKYTTGFGGVVGGNVVDGGNALNLTKTTDLVGVLLDATPKSNNFTVSFAVKGASANPEKNIMYISGYDTETEKYVGANYRLRHEYKSSPKEHLRFDVENSDGDLTENVTNETMVFNNKWNVATLTVKDAGNGKSTVTLYLNDKLGTHGSHTVEKPVSVIVETTALSGDVAKIILGALEEEYGGNNDIYLDELYVFDRALSDKEVEIFYNAVFTDAESSSGSAETIISVSTAYDDNGNVIGIINNRKFSSNIDKRKGWYYVNSHSDWPSLTDEKIGTGKRLEALIRETNFDGVGSHNSPDVFYDLIKEVNVPNAKDRVIELSGNEMLFDSTVLEGNPNNNAMLDPTGSISYPSQFFLVQIDGRYYLRCYFNGGNNTSADQKDKNEAYTQCSYVYYKPDNQRIKVESLQYVLGSFKASLLDQSPRSRISATRFSLSPNNFSADSFKEEDKTNNLDRMTLLDWTKNDINGIVSARRGDVNNGDNSTGSEKSRPSLDNENLSNDFANDGNYSPIDQYNYFLTGGTYTWTGLKSFYTQLAKRDTRYYEGKETTDKADKYVILFTDGRDNSVSPAIPTGFTTKDASGNPLETGDDDNKTNLKNLAIRKDGTGTAGTGNSLTFDSKGKGSYNANQGKLSETPAKYWADKLKEEGYTVFVVMLASGSIDEEYNESEYYTALTYLSYLIAGPAFKEGETGITDDNKLESHYNTDDSKTYVFVAKNDEQLLEKFNVILSRVNSHLPDYTVQDYLDPRFDLVESGTKASEDYSQTIKLGADGKIWISDDSDGSEESFRVYGFGNDSLNATLQDTDKDGIIDSWEKGTYGSYLVDYDPTYGDWYIDGLTYFQLDDTHYYLYTALDGKKARLYYHARTGSIDPKTQHTNGEDMYYMRWIDVDIPGCAEGAPLVEVWNSQIRLRAKSDFIGGNSILTNGNLAYMNYVYTDKSQTKDSLGTAKEILPSNSSGTDKANAKLELDSDGDAKYLPSKGFPRVAVNVRLLPINTQNLSNEIYMGEAISPAQLLLDIEDHYVTDSYYLEYLKRYAYQRYKVQAKEQDGLLEIGNNKNDFANYKTARDAYDEASEEYNDLNKRCESLQQQIKRLRDLLEAETDSGKQETLNGKIDNLNVEIERLETQMSELQSTMTTQKDTMTRLLNGNSDLPRIIDLERQMDMPLIELLNEWLHINDDETPKSFSIPYIYLSSVPYNKDGYILNAAGDLLKDNPDSNIAYTNSAGGMTTNQRDVVGILTYRWEELDPWVTPPVTTGTDPTVEYVKGDTDRVMYSLTVEFTPLYDDDVAEYPTILTQGSDNFGLKIVSEGGIYKLVNKTESDVSHLDNPFFADFLGIESDDIISADIDVLYDYFSRMASNNGTLPHLTQEQFDQKYPNSGTTYDPDYHIFLSYKADDKPDNRKNDGLILETQDPTARITWDDDSKVNVKVTGVDYLNKNVYRWDKNYKPAPGELQLEYKGLDGKDSDHPYIYVTDQHGQHQYYLYGSATVINPGSSYNKAHFRTLTARSEYTKDAVSGGIALELKVPVEDLKKELVTEEEAENNTNLEAGGYYGSFTLKATRQYTDTDYIEALKAEYPLSDYISSKKFELAFEFNYSKAAIDKLISGLDDDDYVSIYARVKENGIKCYWNQITRSETGEILEKTEKIIQMHELPIGTYTFELDDVYSGGQLSTFNSKPFTYIGAEKDEEKYKQTIPYTDHYGNEVNELLFDQSVLNGLWTTHEIADFDNEKHFNDKDYSADDTEDETHAHPTFTAPEINADNVDAFIAQSYKKGQKFSVGEVEYESASVTFYLGTDYDASTISGRTKRGSLEGSDEYPESYPYEYPDDYYINHRLGIIVLSLGNKDLALRKSVENTSEQENLDAMWEFEIKIKSKTQLNIPQDGFSASYVDLGDVDSMGHPYFDASGKRIDCDCCKCNGSSCEICASACNCYDNCECPDCDLGEDNERPYDFYSPYIYVYNEAAGKWELDQAKTNDEKQFREENYPTNIKFVADPNSFDGVTGGFIPDMDGYYVYIATVKIKHDQEITLSGLGDTEDATIFYEVREIHNDAYSKDEYSADFGEDPITGEATLFASGEIEPGINIVCHNKFVRVKLPSSGGSGTHWYTYAGTCLIFISTLMFGYLIYRDSKKKRAKAR